MKTRALAVAVTALCLSLGGTAAAKPWYSSYEDGISLYQSGKLKQAATCFRAALETKPHDSKSALTYGMHFIAPYTPNLYLGRIYLELSTTDSSQVQEAITYLSRSAEGLPDPETFFLLAQAYKGADRREEGIVACREALRRDPQHSGAKRLLDELLNIPKLPQPAPGPEPSVPKEQPVPPVEATLSPLKRLMVDSNWPFRPTPKRSSDGQEALVSVNDVWLLLDLDITWRVDAGYLEIKNGDHVLVLYIDRQNAVLDRRSVSIPMAPRIVEGTAMVPIRYIGRELSRWDVVLPVPLRW